MILTFSSGFLESASLREWLGWELPRNLYYNKVAEHPIAFKPPAAS